MKWINASRPGLFRLGCAVAVRRVPCRRPSPPTTVPQSTCSPPTARGQGRVERQVLIVRAHGPAGRRFDSLVELQAAFADRLPTRRA